MNAFYTGYDRFYVSVDCVCLGFKDSNLYTLITKRKFEPLIGQDSLMGGFVNSDENINEAATRIVSEYTGIEGMYLEQIGAYGEIGRDIGERVVSIGYYALIDMELFDEGLYEVHDTRWQNINEINKLIFDHKKILKDAVEIVRKKAANRPIGFNLLPEKFTLPQLQLLYEAIYNTTLDKRNFRKKILDMDILEKQEDKDKSSSKRGAFYYKFNKEKYDLLLEKGDYFSL
ncbi:MAG: NUDIX domain-containing protein [Dysgonamonadaceae bacterium]